MLVTSQAKTLQQGYNMIQLMTFDSMWGIIERLTDRLIIVGAAVGSFVPRFPNHLCRRRALDARK